MSDVAPDKSSRFPLGALINFLIAAAALGLAVYAYGLFIHERIEREELEKRVAAWDPKFDKFKDAVREIDRHLSSLRTFEDRKTRLLMSQAAQQMQCLQPMRAAVPHQVPLAITVDVEPLHHPPALNGRLPNGGVDGLSLPRDIARQTHVDRKQMSHHFLLPCLREGRASGVFPS